MDELDVSEKEEASDLKILTKAISCLSDAEQMMAVIRGRHLAEDGDKRICRMAQSSRKSIEAISAHVVDLYIELNKKKE